MVNLTQLEILGFSLGCGVAGFLKISNNIFHITVGCHETNEITHVRTVRWMGIHLVFGGPCRHGDGLRRAPSRLCARVPVFPVLLCHAAASRQRSRRRGCCRWHQCAGRPRDHKPSAPATAGRNRARGSRPGLCMGARLLGLEWHLDMDRWRLGDSASSRRGLGGWTLGKTRPRVYLDGWSLALGALP